MYWSPKLENVLTLVRVYRESIEKIEKFYKSYNWLSCQPHKPGDLKKLKYFQEGIALNKRRAALAVRELKRRESNKFNSFERLGF
jgi:hypothetical protein